MEAAGDALVAWVMEATQRNQGELPAFPGVAARLVDLLEQPDAQMRDVEFLVSQDQVVSAQVLRIANSVIFGGAMPVETVGDAVVRLGFKETAQIAMGAACRSLFSMEDRAELETYPTLWRALWLDSQVCAYGGRLLARELRRGRPERVFLAAMFRDLGGLLILKMVARGLVQGRLSPPPEVDELGRAIDQLHCELGANYLRSCHLPDYVVSVAKRHHAAAVPFDADHMDLHVVRLADGLCHRAGAAPFATGELGPLAEESAELLELGPHRLDYFELQFRELGEQLRALV